MYWTIKRKDFEICYFYDSTVSQEVQSSPHKHKNDVILAGLLFPKTIVLGITFPRNESPQTAFQASIITSNVNILGFSSLTHLG